MLTPNSTAQGPEVAAKRYEALLAEGDPTCAWLIPEHEWDTISINCTSGTAGDLHGDLAGILTLSAGPKPSSHINDATIAVSRAALGEGRTCESAPGGAISG